MKNPLKRFATWVRLFRILFQWADFDVRIFSKDFVSFPKASGCSPRHESVKTPRGRGVGDIDMEKICNVSKKETGG